MENRKLSKKYYFSVEGETEQWYLYWLRDQINKSEESTIKVVIDCKIEKDPLKRAKSLIVTEKTEIYHICDYESDEECHVKQFIETMDHMKESMKIGKKIEYRFGYSNYTFDLWIVLHKIDCNSMLTHRKNYLQYINRAFNRKFENMDEYKKEVNFQDCLSELNLNDVKKAIERGELIMKQNNRNGFVLYEYKGFTYYKENPSLSVFEPIKRMLQDCNLM